MSKSFAEIHITGEGFRTLATYRAFFKVALADVRKMRADYDAEVRDWYEHGDGRPANWVEVWEETETGPWMRRVNEGGRGYRFPRCIHGTDLTTDYDNICFGCEESLTEIEEAQIWARERFMRFLARWEWASAAPSDLGYETRKGLVDWAASLFPGLEHLTKEI